MQPIIADVDVLLQWAHTKQGAIDDEDGHNVVFHEFAHQIDDLSGQTDGAPNLSRSQKFADWERVFVKAYKSHVQHVQAGRKTVIDAYGAVGQEEFFAVAVEVFFEKPAALKRNEPAVYEQLAILFRLEPSTWEWSDHLTIRRAESNSEGFVVELRRQAPSRLPHCGILNDGAPPKPNVDGLFLPLTARSCAAEQFPENRHPI